MDSPDSHPKYQVTLLAVDLLRVITATQDATMKPTVPAGHATHRFEQQMLLTMFAALTCIS